MGLRSRLSREMRRRQKARGRRKRHEGLMKAKSCCPSCLSVMVLDEQAELDIWSCSACGRTFLRAGPEWFIELDAVASAEQECAVVEFLRKAA